MIANKKHILIGLGLVSLAAYHSFTQKVAGPKIKQLDFDLTVKIQDKIPKKYDAILSVFSDLGSVEITTLGLIFLIVTLKSFRKGMVTVGFYILGLWLEILGKNLVVHPGTPFFLLRTEKLIDFPSFYVHTNFSYPSGHSYRSVFLVCLMMVLVWQGKLIICNKIAVTTILGGILLVMLVSRVSLGEHWSSDVIGGSLLGLGMGMITAWIYLIGDKIKKRIKA